VGVVGTREKKTEEGQVGGDRGWAWPIYFLFKLKFMFKLIAEIQENLNPAQIWIENEKFQQE
jgi:hypothetical protein